MHTCLYCQRQFPEGAVASVDLFPVTGKGPTAHFCTALHRDRYIQLNGRLRPNEYHYSFESAPVIQGPVEAEVAFLKKRVEQIEERERMRDKPPASGSPSNITAKNGLELLLHWYYSYHLLVDTLGESRAKHIMLPVYVKSEDLLGSLRDLGVVTEDMCGKAYDEVYEKEKVP